MPTQRDFDVGGVIPIRRVSKIQSTVAAALTIGGSMFTEYTLGGRVPLNTIRHVVSFAVLVTPNATATIGSTFCQLQGPAAEFFTLGASDDLGGRTGGGLLPDFYLSIATDIWLASNEFLQGFQNFRVGGAGNSTVTFTALAFDYPRGNTQT